MAPRVVRVALAAVFGAIAALHVYWALSGTSTGAAVPSRIDGRPLFQPTRVGTLAVAAALAMAAAIVLGRAGVLGPYPDFILYRTGAWAVGLVLLARAVGDFRYVGFFKREHRTRFARMDTRFYTPLCLAVAAATLYLAAT